MNTPNPRKSAVAPAYVLDIPGYLMPSPGSAWQRFLMQPDDLLELYQTIKEALGLGVSDGRS